MFLGKLFVLVLFSVTLTACSGHFNAGGSPTAAAIGDPAAGEKLFRQAIIGDIAPGCIICHSTEPGQVINGPSLADMATRAGGQVKGQTAAEYLRNSILNPNVYIVDEFFPNIMYPKFRDVLMDQQVDDLVAYLLTVK
jgi:mono/diheme cytochrome c family protein